MYFIEIFLEHLKKREKTIFKKKKEGVWNFVFRYNVVVIAFIIGGVHSYDYQDSIISLYTTATLPPAIMK